MKKATQIEGVVFDYPLWVTQEEVPDNVLGEMRMSAAGTHVAFATEILTPYITLRSKESGWLSETHVEQLKDMRKNIGASFTVYFDDSTTETVRFAHEKQMVITPLFEGACNYTVEIPLAKV